MTGDDSQQVVASIYMRIIQILQAHFLYELLVELQADVYKIICKYVMCGWYKDNMI